MDLQLLDDLIAVAESGSLTEAANRRNVTQPAFTRRLQGIEKILGIQVIKRNSKPARPSETLLHNIDEIRDLAHSLRRLKHDLLDTANPQRVLSIAALHAISLAHLPRALAHLHQTLPLSRIRLRADNRDECFASLMTGQVRIMMVYETEHVRQPFNSELVERETLCTERMIPICSPKALAARNWGRSSATTIPLVGFTDDGVLGTVLNNHLLPNSSAQFTSVTSTEFSSAVIEFCAQGLGIGWAPELLAADKIASGEIVELRDPSLFPTAEMTVSMLRVRAEEPGFTDRAWAELKRFFRSR